MSPETNPISPDPAVRKAAVTHLDRVLECGQAFGCEILCGPIHSAIGVFSGNGPTEDEFKDGVDTLRKVGEKAQARGIRIAVEYLNRFEIYLLTTAAADSRVRPCRESPVVQDDVRQLPRQHRGKGPGTRDRVVQGRDDPRPCFRERPGHSRHRQVNWDSFWSGFKASGYDGYLTIEAFGRALPALAAATKVWRDLFPDALGLCRDGLAFVKKSTGSPEPSEQTRTSPALERVSCQRRVRDRSVRIQPERRRWISSDWWGAGPAGAVGARSSRQRPPLVQRPASHGFSIITRA